MYIIELMNEIYIRRNREIAPSILSIHREETPYHLSVIHTGITEHSCENPKTAEQAHSHRVYHLLLFLTGGNSFLYDSELLPSRRGLLLLCSPGEPHSFLPAEMGKHSYVEISFEYRNREGALTLPFRELMKILSGKEPPFTGRTAFLGEAEIQNFLESYQRFLNCLRDEKAGRFEEHLELAGLFRLLIRPGKTEETRLPERIRERILIGIPGYLNLDLISEELGRSPSYIIRRFKREYGVTPMAYHRRQRLAMAADLLISTDRSMEEIAELFGYCDVFHFMKAFKAGMGLPPGEYRKLKG